VVRKPLYTVLELGCCVGPWRRVQREQEQLQRKYEAEQKGKKPGWGSEDGGSALSRGQGGNRSPVFGREGDGRSSVASSDHRPLDSVASGLRSKQNVSILRPDISGRVT
jgi:hypothetical protein